MTNFGLSHRNSKWSSYSNYNIKSDFKTKYFSFFLFFIFFAIIVFFFLYFKKYYLMGQAYNLIFFYIWAGWDCLDYYISFYIWSFFAFFKIIFNAIYSYFFFNNFSSKTERASSKNFNKIKNLFKEQPRLVFNSADSSIHSYSFLISTLLSSKRENVVKFKESVQTPSSLIEHFFENTTSKVFWDKYHDFYSKLYKAAYSVSKEKNKDFYALSLVSKNIENFKFSSQKIKLNSSLVCNHNQAFGSTENLKSNSFFLFNEEKNNVVFFKYGKTWAPFFINFENLNNNYLIKNKIGFFFFNNLSYGRFTELTSNNLEFLNLNSYFFKQTGVAKINRWLYRYSILHRKILKNSHKLTMTKKILNLNIYSKNMFNKNLWNSEHISKLLNKDVSLPNLLARMGSFNNTLFLEKTLPLTQFSQISSISSVKSFLNNIKFYEDSYFWFLKRSYYFNSLSSNFATSLKKNSPIKTILKKNYKLNDKILLENFFFKSFIASFKTSSAIYSISENSTISPTFINSSADLFLIFNDNDFFNKNNLNKLMHITSDTTFQFNANFFSNLKKNLFDCDKALSFSSKDAFTYENSIFYQIVFSNIDLEKNFLTDIYYLSFFN